MKMIAVLIFFTLINISNAAGKPFEAQDEYWVKVKGETFFLEYIATYEDRWFYENTGTHYHLFYRISNGEFFLLSDQEIEKTTHFGALHHFYEDRLDKFNLQFNKLPMDGELLVLTGNDGHHQHERMYGNFAFDVAPVDQSNKHFSGAGKELTDYFGWNKAVKTPLPGEVINFDDSNPDNIASPDFTNNVEGLKPNFVTIHLAENFYLSIVHFKQGSLKNNIHIGKKVKAGDLLGKLGNSGVSYTPHLHYTLYAKTTSGRFISIPSNYSSINKKTENRWLNKRDYTPQTNDILKQTAKRFFWF